MRIEDPANQRPGLPVRLDSFREDHVPLPPPTQGPYCLLPQQDPSSGDAAIVLFFELRPELVEELEQGTVDVPRSSTTHWVPIRSSTRAVAGFPFFASASRRGAMPSSTLSSRRTSSAAPRRHSRAPPASCGSLPPRRKTESGSST